MSRVRDWMKKGLMGSTTLYPGASAALAPVHVHAPDGSCCGHSHDHEDEDENAHGDVTHPRGCC